MYDVGKHSPNKVHNEKHLTAEVFDKKRIKAEDLESRHIQPILYKVHIYYVDSFGGLNYLIFFFSLSFCVQCEGVT